MQMIAEETYTPENYPFPNTDINPKEKLKPEYCMKWSKAIYALWVSGGTSVSARAQDYFRRMRLYAAGKQDAMQYKSFINNDSNTQSTPTISIFDDNEFTRTAKRSGYLNAMFENMSPAPKILSSLIGLIGKVDYDILADTVDANSQGLIEFMKYKKLYESMDRDFQIEYKKKAGIPIDENTNFPKSIEELKVFEAKEGFKLNVAKSMQKLLRHTFYESHWDTDIDDKQIDDLVTFGYCTAMDYFDEETQTFKAQWLDPAKTILQYSDEFDYNDSEYGGYEDNNMTISNLRRKLPDLTQEEIIALAKRNVGRYGNPQRWNDERHSKLDPATNTYAVDSWKVAIFKAYWIDRDIIRDIYWKGKGSERIIDIGFDSKVKPLTESQRVRGFKQDIKNTPVRIVYQCSWVVDSDVCFDYGKYHMANRPEMTKPKIPIHARQLLQTSIIERLVPILDLIAVTWLQFLNDLANLVQRGYAINMAMLMNVSMNGKELDPANILTMWKRKGLLPYMPSMNGGYEGGMPTPITPIEGGLGDRVQQTMTALAMYYQQIENTIGINPLSLGVTPDTNAPVSTSEAALQATFNVLKPIMDARLRQKESVARSLCQRMQIGMRVSADIRKAYAGIVSPSDIKAMIMAEQNGAQYGIMLRARPDDAQKASVKKYLELEISKGTLNSADAMYFEERINSGADITEIRQELSYAIEKNTQRMQADKMAAVTEQNDGLQRLEEQKAQNLAKQTMLDVQGKIAEEQARGQIKDKQIKTEANIEFIKMMKEASDLENGLMNKTGGEL